MAKKFDISPIKKQGKANPQERDFIHDSRESLPEGVKLSDVYQVEPGDLETNSLNDLFKDESKENHESLKEDIKERGIIVPLIAKKGGVLLAGHRRLTIAIELNLPRVPVQYIESELTGDQERDFVIKDNLYRRQLTQEDRLRLYKILFPDFENQVQQETRAGDRKGEKSKGPRGTFDPGTEQQDTRSKGPGGTFDQPKSGITAKELQEAAQKHGINISEKTAKRDLARERREARGESAKPQKTQKKPRPPQENASKLIKPNLDQIARSLEGADQKTKDRAILAIVNTLEAIEAGNPRIKKELLLIKNIIE